MLIRNARHLAQMPFRGLYVGRWVPKWNPSPLGNQCSAPRTCPMCRQLHKPIESLPCYEAWLREQINRNNCQVLTALAEIEPKSQLICWCIDNDHTVKPEVCHAQIIARVWHELDLELRPTNRPGQSLRYGVVSWRWKTQEEAAKASGFSI